MIAFETKAKLQAATLLEGDVIQLLGDDKEADVSLRYGRVRNSNYTSSNPFITIANNLKVELFPDASAAVSQDYVDNTAQQQANTGDAQLVGGGIYPLDSQASASTLPPNNNAPSSTALLRDASGVNTYTIHDVNGNLITVSGLITSLNFASRTATIGGTDVYLKPSREVSSSNFRLSVIARTVERNAGLKASDIVSVKDFGAIGDGDSHPLSDFFGSLALAQVVYPEATALTDEIDWAAAQSAVEYLRRQFERKAGAITIAALGMIYFPQGNRFKEDGSDNTFGYVFNKTLTVREGYTLTLRGDGSTASVIKAKVSSGRVVDFIDSTRSHMRDMGIHVDPTFPLDSIVGIIQDGSTGVINPSQCALIDVELLGNDVVNQLVDSTFSVLDAGNDFNKFKGIRGRGYRNAAFRLKGLQSHLNHFEDVDVNGLNLAETSRIGAFGILALRDAASGKAPSVVMQGGNAIGHHTAADFRFDGGSQGVTISGVSSEGSTRFLDTDDYDNPVTITLDNCRYSSENLHADGRFIRHRLGGSLNISSGEYGLNGTTNPAVPKIYLKSNRVMTADITTARIVWANNNFTDDITKYPIIETDGAAKAFFDINVRGIREENAATTTMQGYLEKTGLSGGFDFGAYHGDVSYSLSTGATANLISIIPMYNGQEITLKFKTGGITVRHNPSGTVTGSKIFLKSGANLVAPVFTTLRLIYDLANNIWIEV